MITIKVNVAEIATYGNGGGSKVIMLPVTTGCPENDEYWDNTQPAGKITLVTPLVDSRFEHGTYFVDFYTQEDLDKIHEEEDFYAFHAVDNLLNAIKDSGAGLSAEQFDAISNSIRAWVDSTDIIEVPENTQEEDASAALEMGGKIVEAVSDMLQVTCTTMGAHSNNRMDVTTTRLDSWGPASLVSTREVGDTLEFVYTQSSMLSRGFGMQPEERAFKVIYSCVDGKWNRSEPIYGKIIPSIEEQYSFKQ